MSRTLIIILQILLLVSVVIFTAVGLSGHLIQNKDNRDNWISFWAFKDADGTYTETNRLGCSLLKKRMNSGAGISIVTCVLQFFMLYLSAYEYLFKPSLVNDLAFWILHFLSLSLGIVTWALPVALKHQEWCAGFIPREHNFKYAHGTALLITAWLVQLVLVTAVKAASGAAKLKEKKAASESEPIKQ